MTRELHHDVVVTQAPTPDGEGNGVQAILRAFLNNPVAAVEVIGFIGTMFGLYYTLNSHIDDAKAASEQHYKDLTYQFTQASKDTQIQIAGLQDKLTARIETLQAADKAETDDIRALYQRGDARYKEIYGKLSEHDVAFSKMSTGVDYIVRQLDEGRTFTPHDKRGEIGAPGGSNTFTQR